MAQLTLFLTFLRLGCTSFGGPVAHLSYFREEFVVRKQWLSEIEYANLIALCQFIPGPASSQVGAAVGYARGGYLGAVLAWIGFTLPSALVMLVAALTLLSTQSSELLDWLHGLKLVALAVVAQAIFGMQKQLCTTATTRLITLISAGSLLAIQWQFMQLIVIAGGLIAGLLFCSSHQSDRKESPSITDQLTSRSTRVFSTGLLGAFTIGLVVLPLLATQSNELISMFDKFYRSGALVFGGGHVVLPLLFNEFVPPSLVGETDFFIGYGAAQALPGPLFTFATFLGAASIEPNAIIAAVLATIAIFLPGMLLLFAVLPYWHTVNQNKSVKCALIGINAAVVGLLLAALIDPIITTAISTVTDVAIVLVALFALIRFKLHPLWAIVGCLVSHGFVLII